MKRPTMVWMGAAAMAVALPVAAQSTRAGVEAWRRGDYKAAVDQWREPALAGDAEAQFNLGQAYKLGRGVPADQAMALEWFGKAAARGSTQAEDTLGITLYSAGRKAEALPWLERSVARGEPRGELVLGTMLFNGDGVARDFPRSYALMLHAADSGLKPAQQSLAQMDKLLADSDRAQGRRLADQYTKRRGNAPRADAAKAVPPAPAPTLAATPTVAPEPVAAKPRPATPPPAGRWRVQLGAFRDPDGAQRLWSQLRGRFAGRRPAYVKTGALTRLLVGPYASETDAARACAAVTPCMPIS